jgi:hypothetical protein
VVEREHKDDGRALLVFARAPLSSAGGDADDRRS